MPLAQAANTTSCVISSGSAHMLCQLSEDRPMRVDCLPMKMDLLITSDDALTTDTLSPQRLAKNIQVSSPGVHRDAPGILALLESHSSIRPLSALESQKAVATGFDLSGAVPFKEALTDIV